MLKIRYHTSFKKDYKKVVKRGYNIKLLEDIIKTGKWRVLTGKEL